MLRMQFFGVQTAGSLSFKLFPSWAEVLGVPGATLEGIDLPIGEHLGRHRSAVRKLKETPDIAGALITTHKLSVVQAAGDLIDALTPAARACQEVSALYKARGTLLGDACDATTSGRALAHFLGEHYWKQHPSAHILSLGGGGATVALLYYLLHEARWHPREMVIADIDHGRLTHCKTIAKHSPSTGMTIQYAHSRSPQDNDALVAALPPCSLVINATGMGKDRPGSPVTDTVAFPEKGAAWELNYRGERPFLQLARSQQVARTLQVTDGWHYFLLGWSSVMERVFDVPMTDETFAAFCAVSEPFRPTSTI